MNGPTALPLNSWSHLAVTYDGAAASVRERRSGRDQRRVGGDRRQGCVRIGGNTVWGENFRGLIDEVRIYNRALSSGEIQSDMNTPLP